MFEDCFNRASRRATLLRRAIWLLPPGARSSIVQNRPVASSQRRHPDYPWPWFPRAKRRPGCILFGQVAQHDVGLWLARIAWKGFEAAVPSPRLDAVSRVETLYIASK